ncbi:hypothetical protein RyT2_11600 [Pseudolactococcus yaeyamensis]
MKKKTKKEVMDIIVVKVHDGDLTLAFIEKQLNKLPIMKPIKMPKLVFDWFEETKEKYSGHSALYFVMWNNENLMMCGTNFLKGDELEIKEWINAHEDMFVLAWLYPELIEVTK